MEVGRFLTEIAHFPNIPPFLGEIFFARSDERKTTVGMLQGFVANQGDGWQRFLANFRISSPRRWESPCRPNRGAQVFRRCRRR